ncbi:MAG: ketopantoate reductase family protein [Lachnospiraceae bacterium]
MEIKTVALIGLGAIGSVLAPGLVDALGQDNLRIICDGQRKKRMEQGVTINGTKYHFRLTEPSDSSLPPADLVILAVKYTQLVQAREDIRYQVGPDTILISFLNGVTSEEILAQTYGWERIVFGFARISSQRDAAGVRYDMKNGQMIFGEKTNAAGAHSPRVQAVEALFAKAGIRSYVPDDMIREQWFKFMCNVSENQSSAILGIPFGAWRDSEDANFVREAAAREVLAIANKKGIALTEEMLQKQRIAYKERIPYPNKTSMLQDIEEGRPTEVDMFAKVIMELGKELGIPTPVNEIFYHSIRVLEQKNSGFIRIEK